MSYIGRRAGSAAVGLFSSLVLATALAVVAASPALATITGGCTGKASAASGSVDLTGQDTWTVKPDDQMSGSATAPSDQTKAVVSIYAFGIGYPIVTSTGVGRGGSAGPFPVSNYSKYTRVLSASGSSDSCSGYLTIYVDESPFATLAGQIAAALAAVGLIGLLAMLFAGRGVGSRVLGGLLGLIAGIGVSALLQELGTIDPRSPLGLVVVAILLLLGIVLTGAFHRPRAATAP